VGTDSCQAAHLGYMVAGRMKVIMDDGTEGEAGPGDVVSIPPGHDAEIVGDETCVFLDFSASRATPRRSSPRGQAFATTSRTSMS
jgi:quercetin dioxygenase-like cupin family protein